MGPKVHWGKQDGIADGCIQLIRSENSLLVRVNDDVMDR